MESSAIKRNIRDLDFTLIAVMACISILSCVAVYTATFGKSSPNIPAHILARQLVFEVMSYGVMGVVALIDYRSLARFRWWFYGFSLALCVIVLKIHHNVNGANSWIPLGGLTFEPSEIMKVAVIIWTADYMARMNEREFPDYSFRGLWPILLAFIVPFVLIYKEHALGQSLVVLAIMYSMLLVYVKRRHALAMLAGMAVFIALVVLAAVVFPDQAIHFLSHQHLLKTYQTQRLISFLNPAYQPLHAGYQVMEAQIAVGNGGLFGTGLLHGSQTSGGWVPFQWTDFIFSAIAEQLGFVGASVLILLFVVMLYRMIRVAMTAMDDFGAYLITGAVGMFAFQIFENIGMNLAMTPATGFTLPFVSYGGSSLVVDFISIGLVLSVSLRRRTLRFD